MSNLDTILSFLTGKGLTPAQAAGVAGNLQIESGFRPTALNAREGAIGLAQWEGGRRTALDNYARQTGGSEQDLNTQLGYLWSELQGPERGAYDKLVNATTPADAASVFDQYYERSAGTSRGARVTAAQQIAGGNPTTTGGTSTSAGGSSPGLAVQTAGFLGIGNGWQADVLTIAMKTGAGLTAAALVVIGVQQTVKGK